MILKSGGGGGVGRDVIFTLKAVTDPASKSEFKKLADAMTAAHKASAAAAIPEIKKVADERLKSTRSTITAEIREAQKYDKIVATDHLKSHLKMLDEKKKANERFRLEEARAAARDDQIRLQTLKNMYRDAAQSANLAAATRNRRFEAGERLVGGIGNLARGVAFTGLVGEKSSQHIINTLAAVEGGSALYRGATGIFRGASSLLATGAAGGAAAGVGVAAAGTNGIGVAGVGAAIAGLATAATPAAAAIGALAAWLPTLAAGAKAVMVAARGSSSTARGDVRGAVGEGLASTSLSGTMMSWFASNKTLEGLQGGEKSNSWFSLRDKNRADAGLILSGRRLASQHKGLAFDAEVRARREALQQTAMQQVQSLAENRPGESLAEARQRFTDLAGIREAALGKGNTALAGSTGDTMLKAQEGVLHLVREQRAESLRMANTRLSSAREELELRKHTTQELQQQAAASRQALKSDTMKLATASIEERMQLFEIARKRDAGETLNRSELELASGYQGLQGVAESSAERMARETGLYDTLFGDLQSKANDLTSRSAAAVKAEAEATVKVENELKVKLELESTAEADDAMLAKFKPIIDEIKQQKADTDARMKEFVMQAITSYANSHQR